MFHFEKQPSWRQPGEEEGVSEKFEKIEKTNPSKEETRKFETRKKSSRKELNTITRYDYDKNMTEK